MIRKLIRKIKLYFNPPMPGDVYYGDPFDFIVGSTIEHILHKMKNKEGDSLYDVIPSDFTYRLTIESDSTPYYKCKAEVLAQNCSDNKKEWLTRVQPRRIWKNVFERMIVDGRLEKDELIDI